MTEIQNRVVVNPGAPVMNVSETKPGEMFTWYETGPVYMRLEGMQYANLRNGNTYTLDSCSNCGPVTRVYRINIERERG